MDNLLSVQPADDVEVRIMKSPPSFYILFRHFCSGAAHQPLVFVVHRVTLTPHHFILIKTGSTDG